MNKPNTKCRICGKEYFCCLDSRQIGSWRTMACSPEHYQEYMKRIEESRRPQTKAVHEILAEPNTISNDMEKNEAVPPAADEPVARARRKVKDCED